jgi:hypothetical protein
MLIQPTQKAARLISDVRPWKYREESMMSNEQVAPETRGVTVKLLATVDLGPEIEGMAGRQLRMRMVTIEMESLRTMGREWAGPRIGTPHTGLGTEERFRRWRSRSI